MASSQRAKVVSGASPKELISAATDGDLDAVKLLLDMGVAVHERGTARWTAMQTAASCGHVQIVQLLLDRGADANTDSNDLSALVQASRGGHEQVVVLLLERGADVLGEQGINALRAASSHGHQQIERLLISHGAYRTRYNKMIIAAASRGFESVVKTLLDKHRADINAEDVKGGNALLRASLNGHERTTRLLLDRGAIVSEQVIHAASSKGHRQILRLLVKHRKDSQA